MKISIQSFGGVAPSSNPRYLPDNGAQVALNVEAFGQSVKPMYGHKAIDVTADAEFALRAYTNGHIYTGYRAGLDSPSESRWWLSWSTTYGVDVCRAQIAGDPQEWHFWSGEGNYLRAGCSTITISGKTPPYPDPPNTTTGGSVRLGLPAPTKAPTGAVKYVAPNTYAPKMIIPPSILAEFVTWNFYANPPQCDFRIAVAYQTGSTDVYDWYVPLTINDNLINKPTITAGPSIVAQFMPSAGLKFSLNGGLHWAWVDLSDLTAPMNVDDVVTRVNAQAKINGNAFMTVTNAGGTLTCQALTNGGGVTFVMAWGTDELTQRIVVYGDPLSPAAVKSSLDGNWMKLSDGSTVLGSTLVTATVDGSYLIVESKIKYNGGGYCSVPPWDTEASCKEHDGIWYPPDVLSIRWGTEPSQQLTAYGTTEDKGSYTSKVYVYTWVAKIGRDSTAPDGYGLTMESAPSPPSEIANVYADSSVLLHAFAGVTGVDQIFPTYTLVSTAPNDGDFQYLKIDGGALADGYNIHGIRLYCAVNGVYLLVADETELTVKTLLTASLKDNADNQHYCYEDDKKAAELGEPCPSMEWAEPKTGMRGLINMPNGFMAGFLNRDVYLSDPYHPYAWPESYINTVDYKVVGLGRMDTTLAVLTEGAPYFIQGTDPATMVVVRSDIEQSCVSKRSIVSMGGAVLYASPDGLMFLAPGGSRNLTEKLFTRHWWQKILGSTPATTFHAYGHDDKYIAFHPSVAIDADRFPNITFTGFVFDLRSGQFNLHNYTCRAAYSDPVNDHLYLLDEPDGTHTKGQLRSWSTDTVRVADGRWVSKLFSLPLISGFSCAQVEAETYTGASSVTIHRGEPGVITKHTTALASDILTGRDPFRLEAKQGKDWYIDLHVKDEIFNVVLAQSMDEIAGA